MDDKKDKLVNAFKNARTKINNGCYGDACEDILKECKKTNFVGTQSIIVFWCNELTRAIAKGIDRINGSIDCFIIEEQLHYLSYAK